MFPFPFHNLSDIQFANEVIGFSQDHVPLSFDVYSNMYFNLNDGLEELNDYDPDFNLLYMAE